MTLTFATDRPLRDALQHARDSDDEICGLLVGEAGTVTRAVPVTNVSEHPGGLYVMEPGEVAAAMLDVLNRGERVLATYHSHPMGPAYPSTIDVANAEPGVTYMIIDPIRGIIGAYVLRPVNGHAAVRVTDDEVIPVRTRARFGYGLDEVQVVSILIADAEPAGAVR